MFGRKILRNSITKPIISQGKSGCHALDSEREERAPLRMHRVSKGDRRYIIQVNEYAR